MKLSWFSFYNLIPALWVGGIALFTFIITPARKQFRRLHGVSAVLNLVLIAEGIVLPAVGPLLKK